MANGTRIAVSRTVDAPTSDTVEVLTPPSRHRDIDGSGTRVSDAVGRGRVLGNQP